MKTEEMFLRDFPDQAARIGNMISQQSGGVVKPNLPIGVGETEIELLADMNEVHDQMIRTAELGVISATLLNMHPWELRPSGPHHIGRVIPACPIGEAYKVYKFEAYQIDIADRGGKFKPTAIWPIQLARDVRQQYPLAHGGIVVYMGTHDVGRHPEAHINNQFKNDFKDASNLQVRWYLELIDEANKLVNQKDGHMSITLRHRLAAQWLFRWKHIKELPKWLAERTGGSEKPRAHCAGCKEPVADGAFRCAKCNFIVDPYLAAKLGVLTEETPGGITDLRRLSREQLDELDMKHIETLAEFRQRKAKEAVRSETDKPPKKGQAGTQ